jgi:hypothetical protein
MSVVTAASPATVCDLSSPPNARQNVVDSAVGHLSADVHRRRLLGGGSACDRRNVTNVFSAAAVVPIPARVENPQKWRYSGSPDLTGRAPSVIIDMQAPR